MLPTHLIRDAFFYELRRAAGTGNYEHEGMLACMLAHLQRKGKFGALTFQEAVKVIRRRIHKPAVEKAKQ